MSTERTRRESSDSDGYRGGYRALRWLRRLLRLKPTKDRVGSWGERQARKHMLAAQVIPVTQNWRGVAGELDIIGIDNGALIVVEVKTRHISLKYDHPAIAAITPDKRDRLERLGRSFIRNHGPFCRRYAIKNRRTDIIEIYYARSRWGFLKKRKITWHKGLEL